MIKKRSLVVLVLLCASFIGFGQLSINTVSTNYTINFDTTLAGVNNGSFAGMGFQATPAVGQLDSDAWAITGWSTGALAFGGTRITSNTDYTRGIATGPIATGGIYSYQNTNNMLLKQPGSSDWAPGTLTLRIQNNTGVSITDINIAYDLFVRNDQGRSNSFNFSYSTDNSTYTPVASLDYSSIEAADGLGMVLAGTKSTSINSLSIANGAYFYIRWSGADVTGSGARDEFALDNITISGSASTDEVDWCNLQWPASSTIVDGTAYNVYARVDEAGYINGSSGPYPLISAWIGHSAVDSDPTNPANSGDWTWEFASFNVDISATRAEYVFDLASVLPTGTYYYCSRFQYNGGPFKYGGYNGGFWQSGVNINQELIITPDQVNFCNVDFPKTASRTTGSTFEVYAQAYEPGITEAAGQGAGIQAWIGYNTISEDYEPWNSSGWTWKVATYDSDWLNNDQYVAEIGCGLTAGTYYYASRFQLNGSDYSYGGIRADNVGNFWDYSPNDNNGTLTITDPSLADVVITEIMYNSSGTDDEWIEICNVSGSMQDISNYIIDVGGSTEFIFPCNTTIANGACITIALGDNGTAPFNPDCVFTQGYGSPSGTNNLTNTVGDIVSLYSANGINKADEVTYNVSDGGSPPYSLHVIDASQDNSDTGTNWTEVDYGGSPGLNTLISQCGPAGPEINVEGDIGSYPDIANGDLMPSGTDNTLFASQFIGSSQAKSYRIQNLGTTNNLTGINITIGGANPGDFSLSLVPSATVLPLDLTTFEITFSPLATGVRTADISIANNDADENPYVFRVQGTGKCAANTITITPTSGPEYTIVTVTGTNLSTATAMFNGLSATVNNISATEMEVIVPSGATTGTLEVTDDSGCPAFAAFTVIDTQISSCEGGSALSELFISEVTDATYGSLTYIEIYNATGSNINLANYSIRIYANGNIASYSEQSLNGYSVNNGGMFVLTIGTFGVLGNALCSVPGGDGTYGDLVSNSLAGVNIGTGDDDFIGLYNTGVLIDGFGVFGDDDWTSSTILTGDRGFNFRRLNTVTPLPSATFATSDWNIIDWAGSGTPSCESTNDYSDIGIYDFSTGTPPTVNSGPTVSSSCNTATISVTGSEGFAGSKSLTYQWYYSAPGNPGWTMVPDDATYDDVTLATLDILDTSGLEGVQYYCQIREDDSSCYTASDAVQLTLPTSTWDSGVWSPVAPSSGRIVYINDDYDTSSDGSFSACQLIVNADKTLTITDGYYVEVENNVSVAGSILMETQGSFVQVDDAGTFKLIGSGTASVHKLTASKSAWYYYTYWSSPVENETVNGAFPDAPPTRRFWFNASNYFENGNSGNYNSGQDDTAPWDWQIAVGTSPLIPGIGYASTHNATIFNGIPGPPPHQFKYTFEGPFNNGVINVPVYRNDDELDDNNWNLIGNPYPSAIFVNTFLTENAGVLGAVPLSPPVDGLANGAIFLWSQNSPPDANNPGNQNQNFKQSDYAIINWTMQAAGGDGEIPNRFIPSGQSFFMAYDDSDSSGTLISDTPNPKIYRGNVTFKNNMRVTGDNNQFFRGSNSNSVNNKLWLNLTTDNGVFNQTAIGYVEGASDKYDGMSYDAQRIASVPRKALIYTTINGVKDKKFAIQGKDPKSLKLSEVIPVGFKTDIKVPTLYKFSIPKIEGAFFETNAIYLKDDLMGITHNLSNSDYVFTSEPGEFDKRFEIVFKDKSKPIVKSEIIQDQLNSLRVFEHHNGDVEFSILGAFEMKRITLFDFQGKLVYNLEASGFSKTYNLSNLGQGSYIAKVELSDGSMITKRAIKKK